MSENRSVDETIKTALEKVGLSQESIDRVRLGRGVIGRSTYAVGAALAVLGIIAWRIDPKDLLTLAWIAGGLFAVYFIGALWFSARHPGISLLEGADLLRWRQMDQVAVKGSAAIPIAPSIPDPEQPPLSGRIPEIPE